MKNNIIAIIVAAGTAVVGSSLFSAPAHAQLQVDQDVNVEIKVPEVLYLRTFDTVSLDITGDDLAGTQGVFVNGVGKDKSGITTGATSINQDPPFMGVSSITKPVAELFAVWSNNPDGGVNVTLTPTTSTLTGPNSATATIASVTKVGTDPTTAPGLVTPYVGGAEIEFNLSNASAVGTYIGGVIKVQAVAP
ncbi:hypothetical protein I8748_16135 [Nostoc sp. CENA67]|uniref:WxL domain-containing protein n=1 Tax=Amazonocrinis nigriterrae CENA67 TaxID=2794033 RepID=A0A8J7HUI9_9NOST|nr:hypothetical protein [Amazonocrinis nigriterrae]MBH8563702.1 hypothetical protein [Amazonocrinis nigriterrae CENA67]